MFVGDDALAIWIGFLRAVVVGHVVFIAGRCVHTRNGWIRTESESLEVRLSSIRT